jgi:hypothetical protein
VHGVGHLFQEEGLAFGNLLLGKGLREKFVEVFKFQVIDLGHGFLSCRFALARTIMPVAFHKSTSNHE